jgi:hypothetical protein
VRRYFAALALPVALAWLAIAALIALNVNVVIQPVYWETVGFDRKLAGTKRPGPKIVVAAGSNAYFGIKAGLLAAATGRNAVNLAMQGALPFRFYAGLLEEHLKPGDIVLLPLEYAYYGDVHPSIRARVKTIEVSLSLAYRPKHLLDLPLDEALGLLRYLTFQRLWEGIQERFKPAEARKYRAGIVDQWGDNTVNYQTPASHLHLRNAIAEEASRGLTRFDETSDRVKSLATFVAWARRHDVTVIAALPNTLDAPPFSGPELQILRDEIVRFWEAMGVPVLRGGATLPADQILDTPYHPTLEGARRRTELLVDEFCRRHPICLNRKGT